MSDQKKKISVRELNDIQKTRLKRHYWNEKRLKEGIRTTFADFEIIDEIVSDEEIYKAYSRIMFDEDEYLW